jgi:hypothetical protein
MTKRKGNTNNYIESGSKLCESIHKLVDSRIDGVLNDCKKYDNNLICTNESIEKIKVTVDENSKEHPLMEERLKNQINVTKEGIYNKLDKIDETLKGNGKTGVIEQVKNLSWGFKIIIALAIIIVGGQVGGIGIYEIKNALSNKNATSIKQDVASDKQDTASDKQDTASDKQEEILINQKLIFDKLIDPNIIKENTEVMINLLKHLDKEQKDLPINDVNLIPKTK